MAIDKNKGQRITKKIQYLLDNLDNDSTNNLVEKDLLLGYIRSLYDLVLFEDAPEKPNKQKKSKNKEVVVRVEVAQPAQPAPVKQTFVAPPPPPPPKPKKAAPPPPPPPPKRVRVEHQDLFEFKVASDLSEKLQDRPVTDLNKAFSINDRLLTIDKLFRSDSDAFKETLIKLNGLSSFEDAKVYLSHYIVDSFGWTDSSKYKTARIFVKTIRRRYL